MGQLSTEHPAFWQEIANARPSLSYIDLATEDRWQGYFWNHDLHRLRELRSYGKLLATALPVRPEVIHDYTRRYDAGMVALARRFPHESYDETLPNIVELAMWWVAQTKEHGNNHGLSTNHKTPSSTRFGEGMLCIEFVRDEWLDVNVSNPTYIYVSPKE